MVNDLNQTPATLPSATEMAKIVARIVGQHGAGVLDDRLKTLGLLHDYAPAETRGVRLLMAAFDQGAPQRFAALADLSAASSEQEVQALVSEAGLQPELARWAIDVWLSGLGAPPTAAPEPKAEMPPLAPNAAIAHAGPVPMAPSVADDLVWADAPAAAPNAPPAATGGAMPASWRRTLNSAVYVFAAIGAVMVALILNESMNGKTPPPPEPPPATPAPETPKPVTENPDPAKPDAPPERRIIVASPSDNANDWPVFPAGQHPENNPNAWHFEFAAQLDDGRILIVAPTVLLNPSLQEGSAVIWAVDAAMNKPEMISKTGIMRADRKFDKASNIFITKVTMASWAGNPSNAPTMCLAVASGAQLGKFEPDHGAFCIWESGDGRCGKRIGCGRLQ